jgi:hypothetical protein
MVKDGWLWCETGDGPPVRIACEEEEDFFEALGIAEAPAPCDRRDPE